MTERERATRKENDAPENEAVQDSSSTRGEEVTDKIDDLLDEIDSVLEENAEEFVKNYVQKGGQ
ncbi:MAG: ubiquitin-like protein Pup [Acidimicrobiia bacterium]|nr:MAG: ubiquitin-like protein Pup [Acidimicrobiia bacterium]